jgi:hypothetical protein
VPSALVRHWIPREKQTRRFVYRRFMDGERLRRSKDSGPMLFGRPRWLYRKAVTASISYHIGRFLFAPEKWVDDLRKAATWWGMLSAGTD